MVLGIVWNEWLFAFQWDVNMNVFGGKTIEIMYLPNGIMLICVFLIYKVGCDNYFLGEMVVVVVFLLMETEKKKEKRKKEKKTGFYETLNPI